MNNGRNRFSPEVRERAVRMIGEHRADYAPGRGGQHAHGYCRAPRAFFDGYAGYNRLIAPDRIGPDIRLACSCCYELSFGNGLHRLPRAHGFLPSSGSSPSSSQAAIHPQVVRRALRTPYLPPPR